MLQIIVLLLGLLSWVCAAGSDIIATPGMPLTLSKRSAPEHHQVLVRREYGSSLRGFKSIIPLNLLQRARAALYQQLGNDLGECLCRKVRKARQDKGKSLNAPATIDDILADVTNVYEHQHLLRTACTMEALPYISHRQWEMENDLGFAPRLDVPGPPIDDYIMNYHLLFGETFQRCMCETLLRAGVSLPAWEDPLTPVREEFCTAVALQANPPKYEAAWRPAADAQPADERLRGLAKRDVKDWADKLGFPPDTQAFSLQGALRSTRQFGGALRRAGHAKWAGGVERVMQVARSVRKHGPGIVMGQRGGGSGGVPWAPASRGVGGAMRAPVQGGVIHRRR